MYNSVIILYWYTVVLKKETLSCILFLFVNTLDFHKLLTTSKSRAFGRPGSHLIGSSQSRDLFQSDQGAIWLDKVNHVTSFSLTREPSDWIKSITWPLSVWPGSHLIGSSQSNDLFQSEQGAILLEQINHMTSFSLTREQADWNKSIMWPLSAEQGASWLEPINHLTTFDK